MKVIFSIPYRTNWGEYVCMTGSHELLGNNRVESAPPMAYRAGDLWQMVIDFPSDTVDFTYNYVIKDSAGHLKKEWGESRTFSFPNGQIGTIHQFDYWLNPGPEEKAWFSSAFSQVLCHVPRELKPAPSTSGHTLDIICKFEVRVPRIHEHLQVGILGNVAELGTWDPSRILPMQRVANFIWSVEVPISTLKGVAYKYVLFDSHSGEVVEWEAGENRIMPEPLQLSSEKYLGLSDAVFHYGSYWKGAGVALPVFSLRTQKGLGIGEFEDLKLLIDWAKSVSMHLVQILPINDTTATYTWTDSYPYAAISVFALNPAYANLASIAGHYGQDMPPEYFEQCESLNARDKIDVVAVIEAKFSFFKAFYQNHSAKIWEEAAFSQFVDENATWLKPYSVFSYLRDTYQSANFFEWPHHNLYQEGICDEFFNEAFEDFDQVGVYAFIQYHLHIQLQGVADYARKQGIVLKGDIPIGIYRYSVDAWTDPHLFNMEGQAGAPPDFFSAGGQNWGFPTYKWDVMALDGFDWWRRRLQKMATYFDAYRIDHVLGFFRIWEIPYAMIDGSLGRFNPALPYSPRELWDAGIPFEHDRYTLPYVRGHVLDQRIPSVHREWVEQTFLIQDAPGYYRFRPDMESQRNIAKAFEDHESLGEEERTSLQNTMFGLRNEVLFIQDPAISEEAYHPRFLIDNTQSFQELNPWVKHRLKNLYDDYFYHRHEQFWREQGMVKLPAILDATSMLVCAEDLGMVPNCVPEVLNELGMLGLEIQRMPKENNGLEFVPWSQVPYLSVFSTSSHDIAPLRAWWEEDPARSQRYFEQVLGQSGSAPFPCETWVIELILKQHLASPAMWAIFPLQDILALDESLRHPSPQEEQINDPSNPNHYWRYRMHIPLETIRNASSLNNQVQGLVEESGRKVAY